MTLGVTLGNRITAIAAAGILVLLVSTALLAGVLAPFDPLAQDAELRLIAPSSEHLFGTDTFGRDVFSRVLYGARTSLFVGFLSVGMASFLGVLSGVASAYRGGWVDLLFQRLNDIFLGFPALVLAIVVIVAFQTSTVSVTLAIALTLTPQVARVARASALSVRKEPYILSAELDGTGPFRIIWKHILPNCYTPILAQVTGYFGTAIAAETTLSFLGLGVPPPYPSWGRMLQEGVRQYFEAAPWLTIYPGLALSMAVLSFALLGDALRDRLDVRTRDL